MSEVLKTRQQVEMVRQGLLASDWCGYSKRATVHALCDLAILGLPKAPKAWVWWESTGGGFHVGPKDVGSVALVFTIAEAQAICRAVNGT